MAEFKMPTNLQLKPVHVVLIAIALLLIWGFSTAVVTVEEGQRGVVLQFGRFENELQSGLHVILPFGIQEVEKVRVDELREMEFGYRTTASGTRSSYNENFPNESLMLTGDLNVVDIQWNLQYKISSAVDFLYRAEEPTKTVSDIAQSVMNSLVGDRFILDVIETEREFMRLQAVKEINEILSSYEIGVEIVSVGFKRIFPPEGDVAEAFRDVENANQNRDTAINTANAEYDAEIPRLEGQKEQLIKQAEGYYQKRINEALGDVARYNAILLEYRKSPRITRDRLYYEMMEEVFTNLEDADLIDKELSNFLPLKNLSGAQ